MIRWFRTALGPKVLSAGSVGLLLLGVATMVGCQGLSSGKLAGTGVASGQLAPNPTSVNFGTLQVGSNQQLSGAVTNNGGSSVTISRIGIIGPGAVTNNGGSSVTISHVRIIGPGFTLSGISTPMTLAVGQSANFSVTFAPRSEGPASGKVTITSNSSNPTLTVALSGTGTSATAQLTATPATLSAGDVFVGTSGTVSGSLNASGENVTVTAANTNNSRFTIGGLSLPVIIPAGQSAPFTVTFSPQITGADSATLTFASDAQPSTTTESASGTGTQASTHTVSLSWNASTSPNISGYNIYRAVYANSCGAYSKINGAILDVATEFTDFSVTDSTNYCYATTAVNSSYEESGYSNIVSDIQIPPP